MSLTTGRAPLSADPAGRFSRPLPLGQDIAYVEPLLRRVRGVVGDQDVIDSDRVLLVHRRGHPPEYAFPEADVRADVPTVPEPLAAGYVQVAWDRVDAWYEEQEQVLGHPRNPYHRVDCLRARRRLRVEVAGLVLVDTLDVMCVYESSRAPQLYVSRDAVDMPSLVKSPTVTYCPYKGYASYWSAVVGDTAVADLAWSYDDPHPECLPIAGMLSFYPERATILQDVPSWFAAPNAAAPVAARPEDNHSHGQNPR